MMEELSLPVRIRQHVWSSVTHWGTKLEWMHLERFSSEDRPIASPDEVSEVHWMSESELLGGLDVLGSLPDFFVALHQELFELGSV